MKRPVHLLAGLSATILVLACGAVALFYAGTEFVFDNRFFDLTYRVHNGDDPALEYVSGRGAFARLTYDEYVERELAEARARGATNEDDLDLAARDIRRRLDEHCSPVRAVYLQDGRWYCNVHTQFRLGFRGPVTGQWDPDTVRIPIVPVRANLLVLEEAPDLLDWYYLLPDEPPTAEETRAAFNQYWDETLDELLAAEEAPDLLDARHPIPEEAD